MEERILDWLKKFLGHEQEELKKNKIRAGALGACVVILLIFLATNDNSGGEEIILTDKPPVTKDLPVKALKVEKSPDGVTKVLGANADALLIGDPFAVEEKPKPQPPPPPLPKIPEVVPPVVIEPPPAPPVEEKPAKPREQIILTGVAISGENKTALILYGGKTLFLTIGDEIDGQKIIDITPEFVTLEDNERVYMQKELD